MSFANPEQVTYKERRFRIDTELKGGGTCVYHYLRPMKSKGGQIAFLCHNFFNNTVTFNCNLKVPKCAKLDVYSDYYCIPVDTTKSFPTINPKKMFDMLEAVQEQHTAKYAEALYNYHIDRANNVLRKLEKSKLKAAI